MASTDRERRPRTPIDAAESSMSDGMSIPALLVRHQVHSARRARNAIRPKRSPTANSFEDAMLRLLPVIVACGTALIAVIPIDAQQGDKPPVGPAELLSQEREIALALTAAPPSVASDVDVYVLRRGGFVKVRSGSTGVSCLVERDHPKARYPICYDAEATRTILPSQLEVQAMREVRRKRFTTI